MKIRVIASNPKDKGQSGISQLIGREFETLPNTDLDAGEVQIFSEDFDGKIVLNATEYEVV